jgi:hypothetical protein
MMKPMFRISPERNLPKNRPLARANEMLAIEIGHAIPSNFLPNVA